MDKLTPRGLDAAGLPDGQYRLQVVGGKGTAWMPADTFLPLTSTPPGGDPGMVFGGPDDDEPIFMEGPL